MNRFCSYSVIMSSFSGILSLDDVFNGEAKTLPSLNPQKLELGTIEQKQLKTYVPTYYQPIFYSGEKLILQTPAVHMLRLSYHTYSVGDAILVPISKWLRQQFRIIDSFLCDAVVVPDPLLAKCPNQINPYKSIQHGEKIYLIMKDTCFITQETEDGIVRLPALSLPPMSEGLYSFTIEFTHVYFGRHNYNALYSVNYRITDIHFKPKTATPKEDENCDSTPASDNVL